MGTALNKRILKDQIGKDYNELTKTQKGFIDSPSKDRGGRVLTVEEYNEKFLSKKEPIKAKKKGR